MSKLDCTDEYIQLVRDVAEDAGKTKRYCTMVINRSPGSLESFLATFSHSAQKHTSTLRIRDMRGRLLMHCPVDMLPVVIEVLHSDVVEPCENGLLYSEFERCIYAAARGARVDVSGLSSEQLVRCTIARMTCQNTLAVQL